MKIEHIAIWTRNLEGLKAFYETYFGAKAGGKYTNPRKGYESCFLTFDSGARLELMCMESIPETKNDPVEQFTGLIHFAISVGSEQNVDALTSRLRADGFLILNGPRHTGDGYYESIVLDPDGNRVEITV
jgi:lactoylglutathione lyase